MDIHEILGYEHTKEVARLFHAWLLFRALQIRLGGGLRSQSASCFHIEILGSTS